MIDVWFFFFSDTESLCGLRFQVHTVAGWGGMEGCNQAKLETCKRNLFFIGAACQSDLTSHHMYWFYLFIFSSFVFLHALKGLK